jgi:hypothetical protein
MHKKLAVLALVVATSGGCRMCSDCCDYSPTVPGGLPLGRVRSGSVLSGGAAVEPPIFDPGMESVAMPPITPSPNP